MPDSVSPDVLLLLRCGQCGASFQPDAAGAANEIACTNGHPVPVIDGIPRFVHESQDEVARRTQDSFGYEWSHFTDWRASGETNFNDYFRGIDLRALDGRVALDAGCGMGRHARQIAQYASTVVAIDFSRAIEVAARNTASMPNVVCIQADLLDLPFADASFDFVYSLGVLHHLADTDAALQQLTAKLKPGGRIRIYLYWKLPGWKGLGLRIVSLARRLTTRLPFVVLRWLCKVLSVLLFAIVVTPYRLLTRAGVQRHRQWPLFVYSKYPFSVLYNDQFDRFSAPLEKRYTPEEVRRLMEKAGLTEIAVQPCFGWLADGTKPV